MGISNVLIEGISGAGKTTIAEELERRGYHVIHGDRVLAYVGDPQTGEALVGPPDGVTDPIAWGYAHWIWPADKVRSLIADRQHPISFFCGGSQNFHHFIDMFDSVFVLDVDRDTLKRRLDARPEDEFGGKTVERNFVLRLHASGAYIPLGAVIVDATATPAAVVDEILRKSGSTNLRAL